MAPSVLLILMVCIHFIGMVFNMVTDILLLSHNCCNGHTLYSVLIQNIYMITSKLVKYTQSTLLGGWCKSIQSEGKEVLQVFLSAYIELYLCGTTYVYCT